MVTAFLAIIKNGHEIHVKVLPRMGGGFFVGIAKEDITVTIGFVRFPVYAMFPNAEACSIGIMI